MLKKFKPITITTSTCEIFGETAFYQPIETYYIYRNKADKQIKKVEYDEMERLNIDQITIHGNKINIINIYRKNKNNKNVSVSIWQQ